MLIVFNYLLAWTFCSLSSKTFCLHLKKKIIKFLQILFILCSRFYHCISFSDWESFPSTDSSLNWSISQNQLQICWELSPTMSILKSVQTHYHEPLAYMYLHFLNGSQLYSKLMPQHCVQCLGCKGNYVLQSAGSLQVFTTTKHNIRWFHWLTRLQPERHTG